MLDVSIILLTYNEKEKFYGESKLNLAKEAPKFLLKAINLSLKSKLNIIK